MVYPYGVVVGRFQPFHNGHIDYVAQALGLSDQLYIGIATPGDKPTPYEPDDPMRFGKENNPFSYEDRVAMITEALKEVGMGVQSVQFVEFVPSHIEDWHAVVPRKAVYFILPIGDETKKIADMKTQGLQVHVLEGKEDREHMAWDIRARIQSGQPWEHLVPPAVARFIKSL